MTHSGASSAAPRCCTAQGHGACTAPHPPPSGLPTPPLAAGVLSGAAGRVLRPPADVHLPASARPECGGRVLADTRRHDSGRDPLAARAPGRLQDHPQTVPGPGLQVRVRVCCACCCVARGARLAHCTARSSPDLPAAASSNSITHLENPSYICVNSTWQGVSEGGRLRPPPPALRNRQRPLRAPLPLPPPHRRRASWRRRSASWSQDPRSRPALSSCSSCGSSRRGAFPWSDRQRTWVQGASDARGGREGRLAARTAGRRVACVFIYLAGI